MTKGCDFQFNYISLELILRIDSIYQSLDINQYLNFGSVNPIVYTEFYRYYAIWKENIKFKKQNGFGILTSNQY